MITPGMSPDGLGKHGSIVGGQGGAEAAAAVIDRAAGKLVATFERKQALKIMTAAWVP
jgi:hypothetical protein